MFEFLFRVAGLVTELNRLLGTRFIPGNPSNDTPLGRSLAGLFQLQNSEQYELRDFELLRLTLFAKHLQEFETSRPDLLHHFKRELKRASRSSDGFFGIRFEVNIATSLIRHQVPFTKSESPDFIIDNTPLAIECGSTRVSKHKSESNLAYKIGSCIRAKEKKGYHSPYVALFIDITNLSFQSGGYPDLDAFRKETTEAASKMSFGAIVLFTYLMNRELQRFESNYMRIVHRGISIELKTFLDTHFPAGQHLVTDYAIPREG
jgi:hypothetical protein